jgi:hypothetical protein
MNEKHSFPVKHSILAFISSHTLRLAVYNGGGFWLLLLWLISERSHHICDHTHRVSSKQLARKILSKLFRINSTSPRGTNNEILCQ